MVAIQQLKTALASQMKAEFENPNISPFTQDWEPGIDLLLEVIKFPLKGVNLYNDLLDALEAVLIQKPTDYNALVTFVNYLENYLALVGNLTGKTVANKPTLMPLIADLLLGDNKQFPCRHRADIAAFHNQPGFLAHICQAYRTRNEVDHSQKDGQLPEWAHNQAVIVQNRNSVLVVFLYTARLHYQALKTAIEAKQLSEQPDIVPYLQQVMGDFQKWQQRFVATHSIEKIELYAREEVDLDDYERKLREGYVEQLRQKIPERQLMLLGEAGMGKTTTLQYLALGDAEQCLQAPGQANVPIYIELKLLTDSTLWQEIQRKLPFADSFTESLFRQGKINLFLDGLNEVSKFNDRRKAVIDEIQRLIVRYPDVRVMIAGREGRVFRTHTDDKVPVFALRKMGDEQVRTFLVRNTASESTRLLIQTEVDNNPIIAKLLRVPLMLYMMIQVVGLKKAIPKHLAELMDEFMFAIYAREKQKDDNFPTDDFHSLLCFLAYKTVESYQTNAALPRELVLKLLREKKQADGLTVDLSYILEIATQLAILVREDQHYSFTHEQYLDYYAEQGSDGFDWF